MMSIAIAEPIGTVESVDLREVYDALEIGSKYSTWAQRQLDYFEDTVDFIALHTDETPINTPHIYIVTIDTAKHIALMSQTAKGKEVRGYFIELEKQFNDPKYIMKKALAIATKQVEELEHDLKRERLTLDTMATDSRTWNMAEYSALLLNENQWIGSMGRTRLYKLLRKLGYIQVHQTTKTLPYRQFIPHLFKVLYDDRGYPYSCITPKGIREITPKILKELNK